MLTKDTQEPLFLRGKEAFYSETREQIKKARKA